MAARRATMPSSSRTDMDMRYATLCAGLALAFLAATAQAGMYRWVDQNGRVHYSDTPPPPDAAQVEQKRLQSNVVSGDALPYGVRLAAKNFPVTLYSTRNCGKPCDDGRALLEKRGVPFKEVVVADDESREQLKRVSGSNELPVLAVGNDVRKGYLQSAWDAALDVAGYPRSGPLTPRSRAQEVEAPTPQAEPEEIEPKGPYAPRF